jgi:ArsR family transcriptional regulator
MTAPATASRGALPLADDCCAPLLHEPLTQAQAADLARVLKALADPTRLRLVSMVAAHEGGEACVCELTEPLGLTQPTISHHLKILVDAGIFSRDKRGVWAWYALRPALREAQPRPSDRSSPCHSDSRCRRRDAHGSPVVSCATAVPANG